MADPVAHLGVLKVLERDVPARSERDKSQREQRRAVVATGTSATSSAAAAKRGQLNEPIDHVYPSALYDICCPAGGTRGRLWDRFGVEAITIRSCSASRRACDGVPGR